MADRMLVAFGKYLKILRDRRKMSLSDVVTLTKSYPEPVGKGYLSRVERGLARVGFSKMVALSRAYEVSLDALGEKLALDLEVEALKNAPITAGKSFAELTDAGVEFNQRGMKWHCYAAIRDALPRAESDDVRPGCASPREQLIKAALSHGTAACGTGRYALALAELEYVKENLDALNDGSASLAFQQSAVAKRHLGAVEEALSLADRAVEIAKRVAERKHLAHALETRALLANQTGDFGRAIEVLQEAFAAYKESNALLDCARTLNNLANAYLGARRYKAARRASLAADKLATEVGADSIRARARINLGSIEASEGNTEKASVLWHDALEIARRIRDSVVHFTAEFQLFKLAIRENNMTAANALGRRLDRLAPWMSRTDADVIEFHRLYAIHRKPKQRGVASPQHPRASVRNSTSAKRL